MDILPPMFNSGFQRRRERAVAQMVALPATALLQLDAGALYSIDRREMNPTISRISSGLTHAAKHY
jgi:hypothetical protein